MGSILHCLAHIQPLRNYFLSEKYKNDINRELQLGTGGELTIAYAQLLSQMWVIEDDCHNNPSNVSYSSSHSIGCHGVRTASLSSLSSISPSSFKRVFERYAPRFIGNYQHDAQEFAINLLDYIHEDTKKLIESPCVQPEHDQVENESDHAQVASKTTWDVPQDEHVQKNDSWLSKNCMGQISQCLQCPADSCKTITSTSDPFMFLVLPIPECIEEGASFSITDCIHQEYFETEQLEESEMWLCPQCKSHVKAWRRMTISRAPPILVIHLKRFKNNCEKIRSFVNFPLNDLDLKDIVMSWEEGEEPVYDCYAVNNHIGGSISSGHYTAYAKSDFGEWNHFNDDYVSLVDPQDVVTDDAYMLFYQQKGVQQVEIDMTTLNQLNRHAKEITFDTSENIATSIGTTSRCTNTRASFNTLLHTVTDDTSDPSLVSALFSPIRSAKPTVQLPQCCLNTPPSHHGNPSSSPLKFPTVLPSSLSLASSSRSPSILPSASPSSVASISSSTSQDH